MVFVRCVVKWPSFEEGVRRGGCGVVPEVLLHAARLISPSAAAPSALPATCSQEKASSRPSSVRDQTLLLTDIDT